MTGLAATSATSTSAAATSTAAPGPAGLPSDAIRAGAHITLITGDRVVVDAKGRVAGLQRAKGREEIPVQVSKVDGHTLVIPADAARLIATGKLDRRLFDVTELNKPATRKAQQQGLKLIIGYTGTAVAAKADVHHVGKVRRTLKSLNADAVLASKDDAADLWSAVTDDASGGARTAPGIASVWLDGVRKASLDKSVPQIGADKAWAAGYDGKGVKVAILDTGIDDTHPDLKGQVIAAKNFSGAATTADKNGHGTHVASTVAGTGAASPAGSPKHRGVAPGAKLLIGKVLDDEGLGDDSGIIAGMDWAAEQGADIVNLSLGTEDSVGIDPLEARVNKLSAEKGILFAIAAGNSGENGAQTVGSPGSAEAALTVGAVDDNDKLAEFSSIGPGLDGAIKPDVTAPGVGITAAAAKGSEIAHEVGENPAGYVSISGTSMATPHVAGAAAILKQQHPKWTYTELKGALAGSSKGGKYSPFQQGSGRIQVDKALKQTVIADPVSVTFGVQQWPHTDDTPVTEKVTYKNLGTTAVTLDLSLTATDPKGQAAPAGFFTLGAKTLTVPAGGKASADLTVNTKLGGTVDGVYFAYVTATGAGQSVRTAAAVQREVESYKVTLDYIGRDGKPDPTAYSGLFGYGGLAKGRNFLTALDGSGTATLRVPKGTYLLDTWMWGDGLDWVLQPKLSVTKDVSVTLDARTTKTADITVPDPKAKPFSAAIGYSYDPAQFGGGFILPSLKDVRIAHLGADVTGLTQVWGGQWTKGAGEAYAVVTEAKVKRFQGDKVRHFKASELSTVKTKLGVSAAGKVAMLVPIADLPGSEDAFPGGGSALQRLPAARTLHVSTGEKAKWKFLFAQFAESDDSEMPTPETTYESNAQNFKAGKKYEAVFNKAVIGPSVGRGFGLRREGNAIYGALPVFADSEMHAGESSFSSARTALYRNGTEVGSSDAPLYGYQYFNKYFQVPAGDASYKLTTTVKRSAKIAAASTRIDASWTFRSKKVEFAQLPASSVRFNPAVGLDSKAPAGKKVSIPLTIQGSAAGKNLKSLSVYVSYDYGKTWKKVTVKKGKISVKNPAKGKGISFHAKVADKKGNKSTISIYNAYYGK
ncbi:S8 family serine peptidase [Streptomyces sp. DT2A-34]|uniref:S8 family peptidase n=1 Tax=Streptomyces sp. DT2A-34 TaxID=3051182 RepID=UPI00265BD75A|nr:S8 family serine peptidase [Streptomyces sp. DT2A-34]MDO0916701.1 S8 family serine peptidase [Streptomyces sp. DT2A-34]